MVSVQICESDKKFVSSLVFHFTTPFIGLVVEHLQWKFFAEILNGFKLLTIFAKKAPSQMFEWVENKLLVKGFKYGVHSCSQSSK